MEPEFWVEARTAIKSGRVMEYAVWHFSVNGARQCVRHFSTTRKGGWEVALHLANTLRDNLNRRSANMQ